MLKRNGVPSFAEVESQIYKQTFETRENKIKQGLKTHAKHIPYQNGAPEYVRMYRFSEFDTVISLISQPFNNYEQAKHFSDCFNDSFLYDSYCEEKDGLFYVYSGWLIKRNFMSYSVHSKGMYFEFANWS